jgi:DNA invertase Pin-like site-specific DNA recombinase
VQAALYARVSTRDKDQDPEVQLVPMRQHADARGWKATEYVDRAPAAHMAGRTAWARLVEDARRRQVDLVMVWKLDRAFRSTLHCLRTLESWEHQGVGFACLTQDIDTTSPTGRLLLTVLAAVAEFERGLIAERVKEGMANARRKGARISRPPPLVRCRRSGSRPTPTCGWADVSVQGRGVRRLGIRVVLQLRQFHRGRG